MPSDTDKDSKRLKAPPLEKSPDRNAWQAIKPVWEAELYRAGVHTIATTKYEKGFLTPAEYESNEVLIPIVAEPTGNEDTRTTSPTAARTREPTQKEKDAYRKNAEVRAFFLVSCKDEALRQRISKLDTAYEMWKVFLSEFETGNTLVDLPKAIARYDELTPKGFSKCEDFLSEEDLRHEHLCLIQDGEYRKKDSMRNIHIFKSIPSNGNGINWPAWKVTMSKKVATMTKAEFDEHFKDAWEQYGNPYGNANANNRRQNGRDHALVSEETPNNNNNQRNGNRGGRFNGRNHGRGSGGRGNSGNGNRRNGNGNNSGNNSNGQRGRSNRSQVDRLNHRPDIECYNCDRPGHFQNECDRPPRDRTQETAAAATTDRRVSFANTNREFAFTLCELIQPIDASPSAQPSNSPSTIPDSFFDSFESSSDDELEVDEPILWDSAPVIADESFAAFVERVESMEGIQIESASDSNNESDEDSLSIPDSLPELLPRSYSIDSSDDDDSIPGLIPRNAAGFSDDEDSIYGLMPRNRGRFSDDEVSVPELVPREAVWYSDDDSDAESSIPELETNSYSDSSDDASYGPPPLTQNVFSDDSSADNSASTHSSMPALIGVQPVPRVRAVPRSISFDSASTVVEDKPEAATVEQAKASAKRTNKVRQGEQTIQLINTALELIGPDNDALTEMLLQLGSKLASYGIEPHMYDLMRLALCDAMEDILGKEVMTNEVKESWSGLMSALAEDMMTSQDVSWRAGVYEDH